MIRQNDLPGVPVSSGFDRGLGVLHLGCSKAGDLGFWRLDLGSWVEDLGFWGFNLGFRAFGGRLRI